MFKVCREWRMPQEILWAEVLKETGMAKSQWRIRGLFTDGRCNRTVLRFLTATDVGRIVPAVEEDEGSDTSEWELRERIERDEKRREEVEVLGAEDEGGAGPLYLPTPLFTASAAEE